MQTKYSIKDLEQLSGIKAHTIRAWESRYRLVVPNRTSTNIRYYVDEHLKRILNISLLVKSGMKISQVAKMGDDEMISAVTAVGKYYQPFENHINKLKEAMIDFDQTLFESTINSSFLRYGTDEALDHVIGPFIREVGILWQTNAISVAHEHFVSSLVKMKLFSLIDHIAPRQKTVSKSVILFLPSGEYHELSLLYLFYHLKNQGIRVLYLGQSLPLEYVKEVSIKWKPDFFVSVCTTQPHFEEVNFYFEKIRELFSARSNKFFLTGKQCAEIDQKTKPLNIEVVSDVMDLKNILLKLV